MQPTLHKVKQMSKLIIPVKSTIRGFQSFNFEVDKSFLDEFGNDFIQDVACSVCVNVEKKGEWIELVCSVKGKVIVECDRCLDPLSIDVDKEQLLIVRFDKVPETIKEDDDNVLILSDDQSELDLGQTVYDFICLSLPFVKVHPDGKCNPDMLARLSEATQSVNNVEDSPFSALKDLLK